MPYIVKTTTVRDDVALSTDSAEFSTTYDAWDALLDVLDAVSSTWTDEDLLVGYAAAVASAVHADQALPGMVAMDGPDQILLVLGVTETL